MTQRWMELLGRAADTPYLDGAQQAARWLNASSIAVDNGVVWPADPRDSTSVGTTLYAGTPGPILFFLELARDTGQAGYLGAARRGADQLMASIPNEKEPGLYEGLAGTAFTLGEAYLVTHDTKYRDAAPQCVMQLVQTGKTVGGGVEWNDTTDIISGGAGIGLFLLWADEHLQAPSARDLAVRAGRRLIELGRDVGSDQRKWMISPSSPRELPNFSHGTAGVAYFLATLHQKTGQRALLEGALAGAKYLLSIADQEGDICLIRHDDGDSGKQLYYLAWCHGPAGTARLFYRLYQITSDSSWKTWMTRSARAIVANSDPGASGEISKVVMPGSWDNVSVCCGTTGQAQFFLDMHQITGDPQYLQLACHASDLLLTKAVRDEQGMRWVQAENRVSPDVLVAQTGLMQGASGIGLWLLHLNNFMEKKVGPVITLPDNPFSY